MSAADDLSKLQATLSGLKADGFPPEALEPLERQIAELEGKAAAEASLPPLTSEQRRIWEICDECDREAALEDSDAQARLNVLRGERTFLLGKVFRSDVSGYLQMLELLSDRGLAEEDYPSVENIALTSLEAVAKAIQAEGAAREQAAATLALSREELSAAEEGMERDEAARDVAAAARDGTVDAAFAKAFLIAEEARFSIEPQVVGVGMWTDNQERLRVRSYSKFLDALLDGSAPRTALNQLARDDKLTTRLSIEMRELELKRGGSDVGASAEASVTDRLVEAWAAREAFLAEWEPRIPRVARDVVRDVATGEGLSAVGKMRQAMGGKTDTMSRDYRAGGVGKEKERWEDKANKFFDKFVDGK